MRADPAVALVCAYLRVNGYFTLTEFEVSVATRHGYRALTDLDIIAVRLATIVPSGDTPERERRVESGIIATIDPVLDIDESRIDALFVEVKQGSPLKRRDQLPAKKPRCRGAIESQTLPQAITWFRIVGERR